jgi:hypothetical protein
MSKRIAVFVVCTATLIVIGVALARAQQPARPAVASQSFGRYQIVINPQVRADTFLLDTETGRIWMPTQYTDTVGEPTVWKVQDRVNNEAEFKAWASTKTLKPKSPGL